MTTHAPTSAPSDQDRKLVEMAWDPITRIVGSLGIYTKIDFAQPTGRRVPQHLVDLPRLQHLHEGQGPARRPLHHQPHLRHLRRQPRHLLRATRRTWPSASSRRTSASGSSTSARPPSTCSTTTSSRRTWSASTSASRWSGRPTPACWRQGREHRGAARRRPRLPHHRRHHAGAQPVHRRVLPRGAADEPADARDVLPDGGPARPPLDALPRRRRHRRRRIQLFTDYLVRLMQLRRVHEEGRAAARRPVRLLLRGAARLRGGRPAPRPARLLGLVPGPRRLRLQLPGHDDWGRTMFVTPGVVVDGKLVTTDLVDINLGIRILLGSSYYDDWDGPGDVRHARTRSATRSTGATRGTRHHPASRRSATSTTSTPG